MLAAVRGMSLSLLSLVFVLFAVRVAVETPRVPETIRPPDAGLAAEVYAPGSLGLRADGFHEPISLSAAEFRALPQVTVKVHNGHSGADETYSGVLLATLLAKVNAPLGKELRGSNMTLCVEARGEDEYAVVLSLAEIDPEFHATQVMVADSKDGQPLGKNGPFQLIVPDDKRPARWVHNLVSLKLQQLHPGGYAR